MSLWRQFADPETQLRLSVALSVVALECLVAIWAATSKRHWFWRVLAVWVAIMLMLPIRAWEPAWMFGLSSPLIVATIRGGSWIDRRLSQAPRENERRRYRFSLLDLLLLMLAVGLWLSGMLEVVKHWRPENWLGYFASSISIAVLAVGAFSCTRMPLRWPHVGLLAVGLFEVIGAWWVEYPVLSTIAAAAGATAYLYAFDRRHWLAMLLLIAALPGCAGAVLWAGPWMRWQWVIGPGGNRTFVILLLLEAALVAGIAAIVALARVASRRELPGALRSAAAVCGLLLAGVSLIPTVKTYRRMLARTPAQRAIPRFDSPANHYDEILELAKQISLFDPNPITYAPVPGSSPTWYRREVWRATRAMPELEARYVDVLRLLEAPNAVPYDPATDANAAFERKKGGEINIWRMLEWSLLAESKIAAQAGDYERAADFALAIIRLGDMFSRGGVNIDCMWANAVRLIGYKQLQGIVEHLPSKKLLEAQSIVERSITEREDPVVRHARSAHFDEQIFGWHMRFENVARFGTDPQIEAESEAMHAEVDRMINAVMRTELAIQLFQRDHDRLPAELSELVPEYASTLPLDPYSQPLGYRVVAEHHLLYSIGWDRKDDGGKFGTYTDYLGSMPRPRQPGYRPLRFDFDLATLTRQRVEDVEPEEAPEPPAESP